MNFLSIHTAMGSAFLVYTGVKVIDSGMIFSHALSILHFNKIGSVDVFRVTNSQRVLWRCLFVTRHFLRTVGTWTWFLGRVWGKFKFIMNVEI